MAECDDCSEHESNNYFEMVEMSLEVLDNEAIERSQNVECTSQENPPKKSKGIVNSALDVSLLTANANQLRLLLTYNEKSSTYFICITLVITSLVLEVLEGCGVIIMRSYPNAVPWLATQPSQKSSRVAANSHMLKLLTMQAIAVDDNRCNRSKQTEEPTDRPIEC
uniref:Uncharacterized protein n=1 Tax=Anopheles maculatus TaxID=74869 RepID=A0A182SA72_9DIPT